MQAVNFDQRHSHWIKGDPSQVTDRQIANAIDSIIDRAKEVWRQCAEKSNLDYRICSRAGALIDQKFHVILVKELASSATSTHCTHQLVCPQMYRIVNLVSGLSISVPILDSQYDPNKHFLGYDRSLIRSPSEVVQVLELVPDQDYRNKKTHSLIWEKVDALCSEEDIHFFQSYCESEIVDFSDERLKGVIFPFNFYSTSKKADHLHLIVNKSIKGPITIHVKEAKLDIYEDLRPGCYVFKFKTRTLPTLAEVDRLKTKNYYELKPEFLYLERFLEIMYKVQELLFVSYPQSAYQEKWNHFLTEFNKIVQNTKISNVEKMEKLNVLLNPYDSLIEED